MPCMGPTKDDRIAGLVVAELRKIERFDWGRIWWVEGLRLAVNRAITVQCGSPPTHLTRIHEIACLCYGLLHGRQPADVDWDRFQAELDAAIWTFDGADW